MEHTSEFIDKVLQNMENAFAYHKIIVDENNNPIDYEFLEVNHAFEKFTGLNRETIIGKTVKQIIPNITEDDVDWIAMYGNIAIYGESLTFEQFSGALNRYYTINAYSPEKGYFVTIFNDITTLKRQAIELQEKNDELHTLYEEQTSLHEELIASEEELRQQMDEIVIAHTSLQESERRLSKAQMISHTGNWEIDLVTKMVCASEEAFRIYGINSTSAYVPLNIVQGLAHPEDRPLLDVSLQKLIAENKPYDVEFRILRRNNGEIRNIRSTAEVEWGKDGRPIRVLGVIHDITELKKQQEAKMFLSYYDKLTELPNRNLFIDRLNVAIGLSKRSNSKVAVILLDIDNFKVVNDSIAHTIGDKLLIEISKRLSNNIRNYETLARLGGDEFAVLIQNIIKDEAVYEFCEKIRQELFEPFIIDGVKINTSASMGISIYPNDGQTSGEILKNADTAMYKAKHSGKNNAQFFQEHMKNEMLRRLTLENKLRLALDEGVLRLHYQPQIDLKSGKVRSLEALIRWFDDELGYISPMEFISIAEDTGLIIPLGEWILKEACIQGKLLNETYSEDLYIAVNISVVQMKSKNFANAVKQILKETGFDPKHLELEITESQLIDSFDDALSVINELKTEGIMISMDDFGTGYSSLNYLKQLPIDTLKIDKSFIQDLDESSIEKEITEAIITLVHKMQINIVAEGVETVEQLKHLISCDCDNVQGYLLSKPVSIDEIPAKLCHDYNLTIEALKNLS